MTKICIPLIFIGIVLLTGCGNTDQKANNTQDTTQSRSQEAKATKDEKEGEKEEKKESESVKILTKKWKESAEDMISKADSAEYNQFELKELKDDYDNSFFEFKSDGSYVITRPDEDPGNGKWRLSKDNKTLTLKPSAGDTSEKALVIEELTAKKMKLKYQDGAMLVLIPAKVE